MTVTAELAGTPLRSARKRIGMTADYMCQFGGPTFKRHDRSVTTLGLSDRRLHDRGSDHRRRPPSREGTPDRYPHPRITRILPSRHRGRRTCHPGCRHPPSRAPRRRLQSQRPGERKTHRGVIYDLYPSPARIPASQVPLCGVEGEVAFRFTRDLPPRPTPYTRDEVMAAVDACPAIEVVHSRYEDHATRSPLEKLADCISNGAFAPAATRPGWQSLDLGKLHVILRVNGEIVVEQEGGIRAGIRLELRWHWSIWCGPVLEFAPANT